MNSADMRWRLERAGIINLFDYANEEFVFDEGRLILKGPNGSGKSKAIEVLFPFLFDGDMAPTKLDPFGKRSRTMKWNLLMQKHEFRVGYVWATVAHDDPHHAPQRVSFGACLEAHKDWSDVRSRFFVIEDKRPRIDFDLVDAERRPLRKDKLSELIRSVGGLDFSEAHLYRTRLNELLFGFQTQERMQQWIRLLRVLRKPQLSDNLNEEELNDLLSAALPEIDTEHLESASRRLDQIEESRRTHETLQKNTAAVNEFGLIYGRYARAELRERSEQLQTALTALDGATSHLRSAEENLAEAKGREQRLSDELNRLQGARIRLNAARDELNRSPEMDAAREIEAARAQKADIEGQLELRRADLGDSRAELARREERLRGEQENFARASQEVERLLVQAAAAATTAGISEHDTLVTGLDGDNATELLAQQMLRHAVTRTNVIAKARELRQQADGLARIARQRADERAESRDRLDDVRTERLQREENLDGGRQALSASVERWLSSLQQLSLSEDISDRLLEATEYSGDPDAEPLSQIVQPAYLDATAALERERATLLAGVERVLAAQEPLRAEITDLEGEADPEPVLLPTRRRDTDRPGAPLWRLIDWRDEISDRVKAGIEAALEASGVLDAWVMPDGTLLDLGNDVELVPHASGGRTLFEVMVAIGAGAPVEPRRIEQILNSIGYEQTDAPFTVSADGSFAFGPTRGRFTKARAEFIGAAARAETRRRRITSLHVELDALEEQASELQAAIAVIASREAGVNREYLALPAEAETRRAFSDVRHAQRQEEAARTALDEATARSANADREGDMAAGDLQLHCDRHELPRDADPDKLEQCDRQVATYVLVANDLRLVDRERTAALALVEERSEDVVGSRGRVEAAAEAVSDREERLNAAQGRLEARAVLSEGAERALSRLAEIDAELTELRESEGKLQAEKEAAIRDTGELKAQVDTGRDKATASAQSLTDALATVRTLAEAELLPLALERAIDLPSAESIQAWDAREWCVYIAALPANALHSRGSREHLLNQLEQSY
jgi:uncharacterized protein (TIGR02680 family)